MIGIKNKLLKILLFIILCLVLAGVGLRIYIQMKLPDLDGTIHAEKLEKPVTVIRDNWGVPHIFAQNGRDAYFAYGFSVAQDRLFQMEIQRRIAKGELAEILGPKLVLFDQMHRTLMFKKTAEKYLSKANEIDPRALELMDSFLEGVNFFIKTGPLPLEFSLMGIDPKKFTRLDCLVLIGFMAYSFSKAVKLDSLQTILKQKYPKMKIDKLFSGYSKTDSVTIMESQPGYGKKSAEHSLFYPNNNLYKSTKDFNSQKEVRPLRLGKVNHFLHSIVNFFDKSDWEKQIFPTFAGSNSWVIAPKRSKSGKAILANDLHIAFTNPGIWYEAHLKYQDFEIYGYFLPLFPFPLLGHNKIKAWALTMFENDDIDLYFETFHPKNPSLVKYKGKWVAIKKYTETIPVKGEKAQTMTIRVTPHGPIINKIIPNYSGKDVSMFWVFHHAKNPIIDAMYKVTYANNLKEFEEAVSILAAPGLNFSYADAQGNIAWWAAARLPIRPKHVNHKMILDGSSGRDEILGYLPFDKNPRLINPPNGIIVTANNKSTNRVIHPMGALKGYWRPTDRSFRLIKLLSLKTKWNTEELKGVQLDDKFSKAPLIVKSILESISQGSAEDDEFSKVAKKAREELRNWDFRANLNSVGATIFYFSTYYILKECLIDEMSGKHFKTYMDLPEHWNFFKEVINDDSSKFWDNINTIEKEGRTYIIETAFKKAVNKLIKLMGNNVSKWKWGKIHTVEYIHPLGMVKPFNLIFNIGPLPSPGENFVVNRMLSAFTDQGLKVFSGPSNRILIDYGNLNKSYAILPTGNSGNFLSPYFDDQAKMFLKGKYRVINFSQEQINKNKRHEITLLPEKKR